MMPCRSRFGGRNHHAPPTMPLFGILDDMLLEDGGDSIDVAETKKNDDEEQPLIELYHSLIFAHDLELEISKRLEACTDPKFLDYLNSLVDSSKEKEEKEGLTELIGQIENVKIATAKKIADDEEKKAAAAAKAKEEEEKAEDNESAEENSKRLTNADILRKASAIDAAIALSDDEKPSDFISDCREVVNLSRGFNDSGQMRVGGR